MAKKTGIDIFEPIAKRPPMSDPILSERLTLETLIRHWIQGSYRSVEIAGHTCGCRVTFLENSQQITFATTRTIFEGFKSCLNSYEKASEHHRKHEVERLTREICAVSAELATKRRRLKNLKESV